MLAVLAAMGLTAMHGTDAHALAAHAACHGDTHEVVTHEIAFARSISHRIVFLEKGELIADMPTADFFSERGRSLPRVAQFLSKLQGEAL